MTEKRAFIVGGLLFGDEGKGTTVDYLVRQYDAHAVFRYNGGSQAGHNVVTLKGIHHCFSQFGSGTLVPNTLTYLSHFMFVDPLRLLSEFDVLFEKGIRNALDRLVINNNCPIVTPLHKLIGQIRELSRNKKRFGSCGMGVGEAMNDFTDNPRDSLLIKDLANPDILAKKLKLLQENKILIAESILKSWPRDSIAERVNEIKSQDLFERCLRSYSAFSEFPIRRDDGRIFKEILSRPGTVIFEGAQGALLDKNLGFKPFVTKSNCTFANANQLLDGYNGKVIKLGVTRAFTTRHGNGPFVTEDNSLTELLANEHNVKNDWQGEFRVGWLDLVALNYAFEIMGELDGIVVTNLDRIQKLNLVKICTSYEKNSTLPYLPVYKIFKNKKTLNRFMKFLQENIPFPIVLTSQGPTFFDKKSLVRGF